MSLGLDHFDLRANDCLAARVGDLSGNLRYGNLLRARKRSGQTDQRGRGNREDTRVPLSCAVL